MRKFLRNSSGSILPLFVISLIAIIALVGATIALSMDGRSAQNLQVTADSAALGGATAFLQSNSAKLETRIEEAKQQAQAYATQNTRYKLKDFEVLAASDDAFGQQIQLGVEIEFDPVNAAASIMGRNANVEIRRSAKAEAVWGFPLCVLSLATNTDGVTLDGAAYLEAENCIVWSNSTTARSMNFLGGKSEARSYCTGGGVFGSSRATPRPETNCDALPDPLASLTTPAPGQCLSSGPFAVQEVSRSVEWIARFAVGRLTDSGGFEASNQTALRTAATTWTDDAVDTGSRMVDNTGAFRFGPVSGLTLEEVLQLGGYLDNLDAATYANEGYYDIETHVFKPGTYCGLDIKFGHVRFEPGTYIMKGGPLTVRKRATLTAEGVTIVLDGNDATFSVLDEARLEITAPIEGDLAGLAVVENRRASLKTTTPLRSRLTGSGSISIIGTLYTPRQIFSITGSGAGAQSSPLLQIVAYTVDIIDQGMLLIQFDESKTKVPAGIKPERTARLIE